MICTGRHDKNGHIDGLTGSVRGLTPSIFLYHSVIENIDCCYSTGIFAIVKASGFYKKMRVLKLEQQRGLEIVVIFTKLMKDVGATPFMIIDPHGHL